MPATMRAAWEAGRILIDSLSQAIIGSNGWWTLALKEFGERKQFAPTGTVVAQEF
jgi:hypothetical protein